MNYIYESSCFDLKQIADSGQCFRMTPVMPDSPAFPKPLTCESTLPAYEIISCGKRLIVSQEGSHIVLDCQEEELDFWKNYFDCGRDYEAVISSINPDDTYLLAAAQAGRGIRILRQEPWEMIITFVISQQKTIPNIRALVNTLCLRYGSPLSSENEASASYAFPTPCQLASASLEELLELKLGYRAKYIHRLSHDAAEGRLDLLSLSSMDYAAAMDYLTGFYGIGKKVANCICLFGLHHVEAFPVDTWIQKILMEHYFNEQKYRHTPKGSLYEHIIEDCFGQYSGYAGIMQQYIFYYERLRSNRLN